MHFSFRPITADNSSVAYSIHRIGQPNPWSSRVFDDCLTPPYFAVYIGLKEIELGYLIGMKVLDEVTLMDIGVDAKYQGQGIGRLLMNYLVDLCLAQSIKQIWLEVRVSNERAIQLYQSVGFNLIETRKSYYVNDDGREDALIMCLQLESS